MRYVLAILAILCGGQAVAQEITVGRSTTTHVFVWKDVEAFGAAMDFLRDNGGADQTTFPIIAKHMLACIVPKGTLATVEDVPNSAFLSIKVTSGIREGCRGVIQKEDWDKGHG